MSFHVRSREDLVVDVTPLIDIVFQLLLFFMVTTTFVTTSAIDVDLPQSAAVGMLKERNDLEVQISTDDGIQLDGEPIEIDALQAVFEDAALATPGATVVVYGDGTVDYEEVVVVLGLAGGAGLSVALATDPVAGE